MPEDVTVHCDDCGCGDFVDCMKAGCRCPECACEADVPGVEDVGRYALRMWKLVYGRTESNCRRENDGIS